jgi:hypothetical protein
MMAEDSSGGCDDIPQRVERIREKETEMKKRREELTSLKKKFIEEHLKLGRDDLAMREEIKVLEEIMAECNKRTAADGTVCYELPGDIVSLIGDGKQPQHIGKPPEDPAKEHTVAEDNGKTCRVPSNGQYVRIEKKKQIRTVLHSILDALNERGDIKLRDLAKEFELREDELLIWAKVMEDKGMVALSYTFRGEAFLKKPNKPG